MICDEQIYFLLRGIVFGLCNKIEKITLLFTTMTDNKCVSSFDYSRTYYKCVGRNHGGFKYHVGLIEDPLPFNPTGGCGPGGLYFTDEFNLFSYIYFGFQVAIIRVPQGTPVYLVPGNFQTKWKAPRLEILEIIELCEFNARLQNDKDYRRFIKRAAQGRWWYCAEMTKVICRTKFDTRVAELVMYRHWDRYMLMQYLKHMGLYSADFHHACIMDNYKKKLRVEVSFGGGFSEDYRLFGMISLGKDLREASLLEVCMELAAVGKFTLIPEKYRFRCIWMKACEIDPCLIEELPIAQWTTENIEQLAQKPLQRTLLNDIYERLKFNNTCWSAEERRIIKFCIERALNIAGQEI